MTPKWCWQWCYGDTLVSHEHLSALETPQCITIVSWWHHFRCPENTLVLWEHLVSRQHPVSKLMVLPEHMKRCHQCTLWCHVNTIYFNIYIIVIVHVMFILAIGASYKIKSCEIHPSWLSFDRSWDREKQEIVATIQYRHDSYYKILYIIQILTLII